MWGHSVFISNFSIVVLGPVLCISLICYTSVVILCERIHTRTKIKILTESVPHTIFTFTGHSPLADGVLLLLTTKLLLMMLRTREKLFGLMASMGVSG